MITVIPTEMGVTLKSTFPIEQETLLKLNNPENKGKIDAQLKDMGCEQSISYEGNTCMHSVSINIYKEMTQDDFNGAIRVLERDHNDFLENVNLRMVAQDKTENQNKKRKDPEASETLEDKMLLAAEAMLKELSDGYDDKDILLIGQQFGPILQSICEIRVDFLKEILKKYLNGKS